MEARHATLLQFVCCPGGEQAMTAEFAELLASRILYQLERQNLIKTQGQTVDEVSANLREARKIAAQMIRNGDQS